MNKNNKNEQEKISFREKMKDKKYSAKVQLIGYGVLILISILYVNMSNKNYDYNYTNKINNTINNNTEVNKPTEVKKLIDTITNNYEYNIKIEIINTTEEKTDYNFTGSSYQDILSIKTNNKIYYLKNKEYYEEIEGNYQIIKDTDIYKEVEYKYISLEEILSNLKKSTLDHTTNYSNGVITSTYYLYLKDILPNYLENDYIEFNITEKDNNLNIEIDYSKLMNYKDKEIIEAFDIEIKTEEEN